MRINKAKKILEELKLFFGFTDTSSPIQILNLIYGILIILMIFQVPRGLFEPLLIGTKAFGFIHRVFYELIFYFSMVLIFSVFGFILYSVKSRPYEETSAPLKEEIIQVFTVPLFVHFLFLIIEHVLNFTFNLWKLPPFFWIAISTTFAWYSGIFIWGKIVKDATCSDCKRTWGKYLVKTLITNKKKFFKNESDKEVQYFANFRPPGRYEREHFFERVYLETFYEDDMECEYCGNIDKRKHSSKELVNEKLISTSPWIKSDAGYTVGKKFGRWLAK